MLGKPSILSLFPNSLIKSIKHEHSCKILYVLQAIEGAIGGNSYQHNKVNQWTSNVVEQCLNQLTKLGKPFKYIGNYCMYCILSIL